MVCTELISEVKCNNYYENGPIDHSHNIPITFLRVHIDRYTAVVQKKPVPLKEALLQKLKNQNLDVKTCDAYIEDSKIEWDILVDDIPVDSIEIKKKENYETTLDVFEAKHVFKKQYWTVLITLTTRQCDQCHMQNIYIFTVCKNCNLTICKSSECKKDADKQICQSYQTCSTPNTIQKAKFPTIFAKKGKRRTSLPDINASISNDSGNFSFSSNQSSMILPVNDIVPFFPIKQRSHSDTELKKTDESQKKTDKNTTMAHTKPKRTRKQSRKTSPRWDSVISCEIPCTQIKVEEDKNIGRGAFGVVHKAEAFYHGEVAIKYLNVQNPSEKQINAFRTEMAILKSVRHDKILLYIGCLLKPTLAIVTEFCAGSTLYRHIHVEEEPWTMNGILDITKQISHGMEYLHARGILHRDMKSNNVFLVPYEYNDFNNNIDHLCNEYQSIWNVKIGDFGLATVSGPLISKSSNPSGSILWMAPEVITQRVEDPYTTKSDVYSFAVVLYEMVTGKLPFNKKPQNMIFFLVGAGRLKLILDDARSDTPVELMELITICSKYNRDERLDFVEINEKLDRIKIEPKSYVKKRHSSYHDTNFQL